MFGDMEQEDCIDCLHELLSTVDFGELLREKSQLEKNYNVILARASAEGSTVGV